MFLDDKLHNHVMGKDPKDALDFKVMINELFKICEDHFKPKMLATHTCEEAVIELDRVFNA